MIVLEACLTVTGHKNKVNKCVFLHHRKFEIGYFADCELALKERFENAL